MQETTAEQVVRAAEVVASTVVESVDGCEDRPQGVEARVFVSQDRIQRLVLEQLAGFSEAVEESVIKVVPQDSIHQRAFEQFADFPEVGKEPFFLYLFWQEFQQREKCIEMLKQLMNVPKTVLQDGVQRWYEKTGGGWNQKGKRSRRKSMFYGTEWKASLAEQSAEFPASPDMKGPACTACRCEAGRRLSWRVACWQEGPEVEQWTFEQMQEVDVGRPCCW